MISGLSLTWPDYVIIGIILLSILISLIRGFVREAISLTTWIVGIWLAFEFSPALGSLFQKIIVASSIRVIVSFAVILIVVVLGGAVINYFVSLLVKKSGLSGTDRLIGIIFGGIRGVLVVGALVLVGNMSALAKTTSWQGAKLTPYFQDLANWMSSYVPEKFKQMEEAKTPAAIAPKGNMS